MAFGTQQNNDKDNTPNINTRSYVFMNKDGFDPSALTVGAWNEMLSLRINPALDKSRQTENKVFDYDKSVSTSLTAEKVTLLLYKITKEVIPAIEAGEDKSVGIPLNGGESLLVVGTGKRYTNEITPFLAIHKSLNNDTKKPEMSMFYEFKRSYTIDDYDEKTGTYEKNSGIHSEFKLFIELLRAFIIGNSNFGVHSDRFVNRFKDDRMNKNVMAIGMKVGASMSTGSTTRNYSSRQNVFDDRSPNRSHDSGSDAEMTELGDINDLNEFMNA